MTHKLDQLCEKARWESSHWRDRVAVITRAGCDAPELVQASRLPFIEGVTWAIYRPEGSGAVLCGGQLQREAEIAAQDYREDAA